MKAVEGQWNVLTKVTWCVKSNKFSSQWAIFLAKEIQQ